ncbi:MAG: hypothetical protein HC849_01145 [Oscillatoriales cyanobacterium RU_3_3]|nr:hypothetical protein [Oscillatoriales cyanobacterium RU_3_3]
MPARRAYASPLQICTTILRIQSNCQLSTVNEEGGHGGTPSASLRPYLSTVNCQLSTI